MQSLPSLPVFSQPNAPEQLPPKAFISGEPSPLISFF
jgi:hypothetical protein